MQVVDGEFGGKFFVKPSFITLFVGRQLPARAGKSTANARIQTVIQIKKFLPSIMFVFM